MVMGFQCGEVKRSMNINDVVCPQWRHPLQGFFEDSLRILRGSYWDSLRIVPVYVEDDGNQDERCLDTYRWPTLRIL